MTQAPDSPWWAPHRHADRRPALLARNRAQAALRQWFAAEGFTEVDPYALQVSPGNEVHLHAFATEAIGNDGQARRMYLHTSPEFAMKKLLAAGETRIFAFAHVWRNRERGARHSPEFTMLEWYRTFEDYSVLMQDCAALARLAAQAAGSAVLRRGEATCDPFAEPERLGVPEAFARFAGLHLLATIAADGSTNRDALAAQMQAQGLKPDPRDGWSDLFSRVLVERVEPNLGQGRLTFLDRYPIPEAALARPLPQDARLSERFEVYACGVELANGFGELTDAAEQRRRFQADMALRQQLYGESYPIDESFLDAVAQMPQSSGIALGFDRLVMLATGAPTIDDVIWAPVG